MSAPEIREVAFGSPAYDEACSLRDELLRRPLGLTLTAEDREGEERQWHLVAEAGGKVVACLVLQPLSGGELKMRQVAVAAAFQKRGLGRALVERAEALGRERGSVTMVLHARLPVVPFYEMLGYRALGEPFVEVTIPHRRMHKAL